MQYEIILSIKIVCQYSSSNSKLLFNISGGVIFQDELLEKKNAVNKNVASIQNV